MTQTNIRYNGIDMVNVLLEGIDQELIREDTGVDPLYIQNRVSVNTVLHFSNVQATTIGRDMATDGTTLAEGYDAIIDNLLQPRRSFLMTTGGNTLFNIVPGAVRPGIKNPNKDNRFPLSQTDVNHGPITSVRVLELIAGKSMRIQFVCTFCTPYCDVPGQTRGGVLSFRFWIAEDIDCTDWTTERVYHGRIRVAHLGHNVLLELRNNYKFPTLQRHFLRRRISLNQSPNGLELEFTITDKEVWAVPPSPATDWHGYHSISSPKPGGQVMFSELYLRLKGPRDVPKRHLISLIQRIMVAKLHIDDLKKNDQTWLQSVSYKDLFHENTVEAHAVVKMVGRDDETKLWNVADLNNTFGLKLDQGAIRLTGYDNSKAFHANPTATLKGLFLAFLNDPCHVLGFPADNPKKSQKGYDQGGEVSVVDQGEDLEQSNSKYSDEHAQGGAYNIYRMVSEVDSDHGTIQMPLGKKSGSQSSTSSTISLYQGYSQRRIRIEAERLGNWPTLPEPKDFTASKGNITHNLLQDKIHPSAPQLSADGRKTLYHVGYEILFGLSKVPDYSKGEVPAALAPFRVPGQSSVFAVPAAVFKAAKGLITPDSQ